MADRKMSEPVRASRQFAADFALACRHYKCPADEVEQMKICARANMGDAVICFSALAMEIKKSDL